MKIIDENGAVLTTEPDLEAGYLVEDVEVIHHDAVEGTAPVSYTHLTLPTKRIV